MSEYNNVYERVTQQIVSAIETTGEIPWKRSWVSLGLPFNGLTGKHYNGGNIPVLYFQQMAMGWPKPVYFGFEQIKEWGVKQNRFCHVRKGEGGTVIMRPQIFKDKETGEERLTGFGYTKVWNIAQIEGMTDDDFPVTQHQFQPIEDTEKVFYLEGLKEVLGDHACYIPDMDQIIMPLPDSFTSTPEYYQVRAHEYTHATGAKNRLNREGVAGKYGGNETYSYEELIAEIGSNFLMARLGIEYDQQNSIAYLQNWLKVLKSNTTWLVKASAEAAKAVDYLFMEEKEMGHV